MNNDEKVFEILAKVSNKEKGTIKPEHELTADLGIDSPKVLQLLMDLEDGFKIEIPEEDAAPINTVNDILAYINKRTSSPS